MERRISFGAENQHTLVLRDDADSNALVVDVNGTEAAHGGSYTAQSHCVFWFQTGLPDARRLLLKVRIGAKEVEELNLLVNPNNEQLKALGLDRLQGSVHAVEHRAIQAEPWILPWRGFPLDLGAFVGQGFRFSLAGLIAFTLLYGLCMSITIGQELGVGFHYPKSIRTKPELPILLWGAAWLFIWGAFLAAAVGHNLRHPDHPPERRGWTLVRGALWATGLGFWCASLIGSAA